MDVEASTQITHLFAEAEDKNLLLFVNVKQEKYDSSSKQVKIVGFSVFKCTLRRNPTFYSIPMGIGILWDFLVFPTQNN
jgi:hypothetical protein